MQVLALLQYYRKDSMTCNDDGDGIYGIYNAANDKVTIHVPFGVALSLLFR